MAVPIRIQPDTPESNAAIEQSLDQARVRHAKAVLAAYELLGELNRYGVLDVLRGALGAGDAIVTKLATAANTQESINAVRNLVSLSRILGSIDPEVLHRLADEITAVKPAQTPAPPPRLWTAVKIFASKDSRRALVGAAAFLQAFGKAIGSAKPDKTS